MTTTATDILVRAKREADNMIEYCERIRQDELARQRRIDDAQRLLTDKARRSSSGVAFCGRVMVRIQRGGSARWFINGNQSSRRDAGRYVVG